MNILPECKCGYRPDSSRIQELQIRAVMPSPMNRLYPFILRSNATAVNGGKGSQAKTSIRVQAVGEEMHREPIANRFWRNTDKTETCWLWKGRLSRTGYGLIDLTHNSRGQRTKATGAHRIAWEIANGPIPKAIDGRRATICHTCDVRHCVNPAHLFLATQKENMHDALTKNRISRRGTSNPRARLTVEDVHQIRQLASSVSAKAIAEQFQLSPTYVYSVIQRRTWAEV
jgi:HNH endonuclease